MHKIIRLGFIVLFGICFLSTSIDGSDKGSSTMILSSESTSDAYRGCIMKDSKEGIHVAWKDNSDIHDAGSDWDVFYRYKEKNGTWTETILATPESFNDSTCLSLTIDKKDTLHLAYKDNSDIYDAGPDWDIFYASRSINGEWSTSQLISNTSTGVCSCPTITSDKDDTIHLAWTDTTSYENDTDADLYYCFKKINSSWSNPVLVSRLSNEDSYDPFLVCDQNDSVHIVWYEQCFNQEYAIMYAYKTGDNAWSETMVLSSSCSGASVDPWIAVDMNDRVHVVWNDNSDILGSGWDYDIFYRMKSNSNGWREVEVVSKESGTNCKWPSMQISKTNTIYVAWSDKTAYKQKDSDYDIVITYKTPYTQWQEIREISTESTMESNWPRFIIDTECSVHMTWWDRTPTTWVTYYKMETFPPIQDVNETPYLPSVLIICTLFCSVFLYYLKKNKRRR